ncbi:MAG: hypothetical protein FJ303_05745 [Planctomycetes bacterium]|nr:hypothetical protein [Planctomycetota bacterium]
MNNTSNLDEARPEMDDLLNDYFKNQMPKPWPAFKEPATTTQPKAETGAWSNVSARVVLAACVAALIFGYLTLGTFFPTTQAPSGVHDMQREIGHRDKPKNTTNQSDEPVPMVP